MSARTRVFAAAAITAAAGLCAALYMGNSVGAQGAGQTGDQALVPLQLKVRPTIRCIGVMWDVKDDSNVNATGEAVFREKGSTEWRQALPLRRTPPRDPNKYVQWEEIPWGKWGNDFTSYAGPMFKRNYLAGSIFNLKPATTYEVRVTLSDPDGGGATRTETVTTRAVPMIPANGNVIEVRGGGDALKAAAQNAKAGDILNVHAGTYNGGVIVSASGAEDRPISIRAAGDGEALLTAGDTTRLGDFEKGVGILVKGSHVRIQGLSLYGFWNCVNVAWGAADVAVMKCLMNHFGQGIVACGDDGYYADNVIRESWWKNKDAQGILFAARHPRCSFGNVACYNEISLVGDAFEINCGECDVYGNDVMFCGDDALETDEGYPNLRLFDNRFSFTGMNGISFQPYIGGPCYLVRNTVFVMPEKECAFKNRFDSENVILINNTLVSPDGSPTQIPWRTYARNNLFVTNPATGLTSMMFAQRGLDEKWMDLDYNGYGGTGPLVTPKTQESTKRKGVGSIGAFFKATGLEKHGIIIPDDQVFARKPGAFEEYRSGRREFTSAFKNAKGRPHPDLSLQQDSPAIDAGVVAPNITEKFEGKAPDIGALEFGAPPPHWGPRPAEK
jgi:hypothetical protein